MKEKELTQMEEKFKEEIQASKDLMAKIQPQIEEFKEKYPKVGVMLHLGILGDKRHLVFSAINIVPYLALQICSDVMDQILTKAKKNETENS